MILICTGGGIHRERVEPASPILHGDVSWVGSTPRSTVQASLHLLALQLKPSWPVRFESAVASALHLHTLPFYLNPGDARDRNLIGRGVLITLPFVEPLCRSVGAQSQHSPALARRPFDTLFVDVKSRFKSFLKRTVKRDTGLPGCSSKNASFAFNMNRYSYLIIECL